MACSLTKIDGSNMYTTVTERKGISNEVISSLNNISPVLYTYNCHGKRYHRESEDTVGRAEWGILC
jgi:hypothetical protein